MTTKRAVAAVPACAQPAHDREIETRQGFAMRQRIAIRPAALRFDPEAEADGSRQCDDRSDRRRDVVTYAVGSTGSRNGHEASTRAEIARRLAAVARFEYAGEYDPEGRYDARPYFVPSETLTRDEAARLRIGSAGDLFGGVVPACFAATKAITHPLVDDRARAPQGWSPEFPLRVADSVLPGFSAFTAEDALHAGRALLELGPVRVKLASGIAGMGQWTAQDACELSSVIAAIDAEEFDAGVVVEQNLDEVETRSVGQFHVAGVTATYCGAQQLTLNNSGVEVYGGSALHVVRGGFETLLALDLPSDMRLAIAQARAYDDAATACFPGFFASRRNYDVAQGTDSDGTRRSGVLEQSWRLGGASGAEIAALEAFSANSSLRAVRAVSREIYGDAPPVPESAAVYFRGVDPKIGALTKYTMIEAHADAR
jgi:hypothetical protein